jgi:hypothetical protein
MSEHVNPELTVRVGADRCSGNAEKQNETFLNITMQPAKYLQIPKYTQRVVCK